MDSVKDLSNRLRNPGEFQDENDFEMFINWFLEDLFKMIKNINETSLPGKDRTDRIIELETKYGIPKTHLL